MRRQQDHLTYLEVLPLHFRQSSHVHSRSVLKFDVVSVVEELNDNLFDRLCQQLLNQTRTNKSLKLDAYGRVNITRVCNIIISS